MRGRRGALLLTAGALALMTGLWASGAWADDAGADAPVQTAPPAPKAEPTSQSISAQSQATSVKEVIVNGIPYRETVLPTRMSTNSVYGLDLGVLDTPRNTTLLSTTQLETLNIEDPRAFSYLTSSSYSDSAFGTPNIPRIRGQYADVFVNGMRSSFTENGYGAPINMDAFENIAITKGPASVVDGPGPGVGGEVDLITKRPSLSSTAGQGELNVDSMGNRRFTVDVGGPIVPGELGVRLAYSGQDSQSTYFTGHFWAKNALYGALRWRPNDAYQLDFNAEVNAQRYTENVGINRVNQAEIDHGTYLTGAPTGELFSALIGSPPIPVGSPGNPFSPVPPIFTIVTLTGQAQISPHVTIDQTPGVETHSLTFNAQLIQTWKLGGGVTVENNTFFAFQNSDNQAPYYFADESNGSWTLENRTDATFEKSLFGLKNQAIVGGTVRFAHVEYISDFNAETISVYDLTANPNLWRYSNAYQLAFADSFFYKTPFGATQLGNPGRDSTNFGNTGISDLIDGGLFVQDRVELTDQLSVLLGGRIDFVQDRASDPLGGPICGSCFNTLPQSHSTDVYGLGNGNISIVYKPREWISGYATFDYTQSLNPNGGEGGVNAFGQVPDSTLLQSTSYLYEAGLKLNLLHNKLFGGLAVFDQKHAIPTGLGGTVSDEANIRGLEVEANYQPTRSFFATASYSFIQTTLNKAPGFYDYPAQLGDNVDGAGLFAVFKTGERFKDPGVPEHVFNFLGNYKFADGFGVRSGFQVTGPIQTTPSGWLDVNASDLGGFLPLVPSNIASKAGPNGFAFYKSPEIPWQFTVNAAVFYEWSRYRVTVSVYNLTGQRNWQPSPATYGNDFLVQNDPRTVELRLQAKF